MSNLTRVTITGADDGTDIQSLLELAQEFPFLELGILVSKTREGSPRFPSRNWVDRFVPVAHSANLNVSTHLCGRWVRQLLLGQLDWSEVPSIINVSQRLQINTHAETLPNRAAFAGNLHLDLFKEVIFQWDGVNNYLTHAARSCGINATALFDKSGGAGILPDSWPLPEREFWCGYAGGLGPHNVIQQLERIDLFSSHLGFWIDMEGKVRTDLSLAKVDTLDLNKVRTVLELTAPLVCDAIEQHYSTLGDDNGNAVIQVFGAGNKVVIR